MKVHKKTGATAAALEFASVVDALRCAVEVQREMVGRNADVPPDRRIEFGMGINLGDIIKDGRVEFYPTKYVCLAEEQGTGRNLPCK